MNTYTKYDSSFKGKELNCVIRDNANAPDSDIDKIIEDAPHGSLASKHLSKDKILLRSHKIATLKSRNKVVAYLIANKIDGNWWIEALEVFPAYKGYGLSENLMDIAVNNFGATYLTVAKKNKVAHELYKKYGFKDYKDNGAALIMKR